ncbi:N-acetylglucosamine-1-phosphate uridyltransferase / Glucosamine-1-phosphate N-acetyltransferase [invertebrate metagenome]|uniref:N-acetylglucosamine-1-phosphate uridyltransferase / Glucosamine-1-phosphate N-acetyltransferase n=1 Tax=invertebrate metagenome TaxID=1711999 RepID=A0A484H614_9ZZZZ
MQSNRPKVLHPLAGCPMIRYLINTVEGLAPERVIVIVGPEMEDVTRAVAPHTTLIQHQRLGTGHAVATARDLLREFHGEILVLYGDTPLLSQMTMDKVLAIMRSDAEIGVVVLGFYPQDPVGYGRLIVASDNSLSAIIEHQDATAAQRTIGFCNSGIIAVRGEYLFSLLDRIGNDNARGEYYLTDIVTLAQSQGVRCAYLKGDAAELLGINTQRDLARAEALVQDHMRGGMLDSGVTLVDPLTVHCCFDTKIGRNVIVHPYVVFGPGVVIGDNVEIHSFCHIEQTTIAACARVGPYARLRPGATIHAGAHIGNFVEVKAATIEAGAKVNHLSYIGDARVGVGANIGAGTIFCNYNGYTKSFTDVGAGAFIGSNSALVAPVTIGNGAIIGAGSVITNDVSEDALAVTRGAQREMPEWASLYRVRKEAQRVERRKNK